MLKDQHHFGGQSSTNLIKTSEMKEVRGGLSLGSQVSHRWSASAHKGVSWAKMVTKHKNFEVVGLNLIGSHYISSGI